MCLTLANAAAVFAHEDGRPAGRGYTRTRHHVGHLTPGDLWCPEPDRHPRTVTAIHHLRGGVTLIDQNGVSYPYPADGVIPTAVPDPLHITAGSARHPRPDPLRAPAAEPSRVAGRGSGQPSR